jgi:hypothetical protein
MIIAKNQQNPVDSISLIMWIYRVFEIPVNTEGLYRKSTKSHHPE